MSHYFLNEAEEKEEDEKEYSEQEIRKLKKRKHVEDSSEEEDDDEEELKLVSKNFIDDNDEDDADSDDSSDSVSGKRKRDSDESDDEGLSDDDLALIEENTGVKLKKKFKRLRRLSDDEDESDTEVSPANRSSGKRNRDDDDFIESSGQMDVDEQGEDEGDDSDDGSFIVDDDGEPIQKSKKRVPLKSSELEAARDIFGCDFDYGEFEEFETVKETDDFEDDDASDIEEPEIGEGVKIKRTVKKALTDLYEPSELERVHLTDRDQEIRLADIPERFQTRDVPVTPTRPEGEDRSSDKELEEEAKWIYHHAFFQSCISDQEARKEAKNRSRRDVGITQKIYNALDLIRNSTCEVPFLAFYRKEEVQPELNIHDLWKIYEWDEKWCQLGIRKKNLKNLYRRMAQFKIETIMSDPQAPIPDNVRLINEDEIESIDRIETPEQFNDYYRHFLLYYGKDQDTMKEYFTKNKNKKTAIRTVKVTRIVKRKKLKKKLNIDDEDDEGIDLDKESDDDNESEEVETEVETEVEEELDDNTDGDQLKKAIRRHEYELLTRVNVLSLAKKFGLTPQQFGENLRDSYQRYDVEQDQENPVDIAQTLVSKVCATPERVLEAAVRMVGWEIASEPLVRSIIREAYFERAKISVRATPKGRKLIDEHHPLFQLKYLSDKPVNELAGDQFLKLKMGVEEALITLSLSDDVEGHTSMSLLEEIKTLYYRDEYAQLVQDWNELRGRAVTFAYGKVIADLKRELTQRLLSEAKNHVSELCCRRLYNWLSVAPYNPGDFSDEDQYDWGTEKGYRVLAIAYEADLTQAAFGCLVDDRGESSDILRLPHLLKRKNAFNAVEARAKESDLAKIRDFISRQKPHAIVVGGESREALMVIADVKEILKDLEDQEQFPVINVELMENDFAKIYASSKKGQSDFHDYPTLLRQAVSLGRRLQDPLHEFSQLCNADDEILNLSYHSLQSQLSPAELLKALTKEFVNRVNEVGVDLNKVIARPHMQNIVQFICGLGPRKANALLRSMRQEKRLENRNHLVVSHHMGPKLLINCAGFIKIDTNSLGDSDNYIEILDSTRIHPEAYDWARKMAVDALEYDDNDGKPAEALEEILETPERLSELDLEAFARELYNQGFGKKNMTLYDIRHELNHRYKDFRLPYKPPSFEEIFNMLTKESPDTFFIGKLVQATVIDFIHRKPKGEQLDNANPLRREETGLWQCPFCLKNDFPELSEVWNHFDAEDCPGQAIGIRVRLDNGISGFINVKNLSDKTVTNPSERVKKYGLIHCRIIKIDPEKFSVELTSRTSDLQDKQNKWKPPKDRHYDAQCEESERNKDIKKLEKKKTQYHKRVIAHPSFKNIDYAESEKLMQTMDIGDAIIRPSSKGVDHLTVTWKVTNGICQHVDIREQDKQNDFSLGQKLWIGTEEFEDLDEILARYIAPMASNARQIIDYKYYKESFMGNKEKCGEYLKDEKKRNPRTIPYIFSPSKTLPGKFLLSYLPRSKVINEYVTVVPEGLRFRQKYMYPSMGALLKWFKNNFRTMSRPSATPVTNRTPMTNRTPYIGNATPLIGVDSSAIQKVAQNLPSHMVQSLSAAASVTPYGTPYSTNNNPYTPSAQTPFMTPYESTPANPYSNPSRTPSRSDAQWAQVASSWAQRNNRKTVPKNSRTESKSSYNSYSVNATPRSVRSTPKTINSPSNMSIAGDQTPLYDE